ncbi:MAG: chromosome segregation SMC family protein, partial [Pseudomonadota bacterium]
MRISRLKLLGFKSFVDPMELVIEPGLTGVVGPNGCGKSNLLEALRWAMGETSHKSMRAAAMDDVIFSGTNSRPSRNMAEVTMVLDNQDRVAPAEYNDSDIIEITRRIEREMGSAYRINGREARARDVKLLFEDASTGARSPSLVRQGQIGDIVNAKPEARRRILEDAAGTAGLYTRRHEAELRLNAAEANLARLDDVVGGLNTQVESLKRQARQARRYKDLSGEIRKAEALFMFVCWSDAAQDADASTERLREIMVRHGEAVRLESESLKSETQTAEQLEKLREAEAIRAAVMARKRIELEHFDREIARAEERAADLKNRIEQVHNDIGREQNFQSETVEIIARLTSELDDVTARATNDVTNLQAAQKTETKANADCQHYEAKLSEATTTVAMKRARKSELDASFASQSATLDRLITRHASLEADLAKLTKTAPAQSETAASEKAAENAEAEITALDQKITKAEAEIAKRSETATESTSAVGDARLKLAALETEQQTLSKIVVSSQSSNTAAVVDCITVSPGFETALGAALGDDLEAPVDSAQPIHWRVVSGQDDDTADKVKLPAGAEPLISKVSGPPELQRRLENIGIVAKENGPTLQLQLTPGQRLVSPDGDLWR